jgi:hypothetical protein
MSANPLAVPKIGETFMLHVMTVNINPGYFTYDDTIRTYLTLPTGLTITSPTAARCVLSNASMVGIGSTTTCAPVKTGVDWRFPDVALANPGGGQVRHIFVPVKATQAFSASLTRNASHDPTYDCTTHWANCIQARSDLVNNHAGLLPDPMVTWVPIRVQGTLAPTAPSAPLSATASPRSAAAVVAWGAPANLGGATITHYAVTARPGGRTCSTTGARSCVVTGLANGTSYTFTVRATNRIGTGAVSAPSVAVVAGAPSVPRSLAVAFPSAGVARYTWLAPASAGASPIVRYDGRARGYNATTVRGPRGPPGAGWAWPASRPTRTSPRG